MGVRGTTHAILQKRVINHDRGGTFVQCAWSDCYKDGFESHKITQHAHARTIPCDSSLATHVSFVFCTERHRQYWLACSGEQAHDTEARNNGRISGMLPPGYRNSL